MMGGRSAFGGVPFLAGLTIQARHDRLTARALAATPDEAPQMAYDIAANRGLQ